PAGAVVTAPAGWLVEARKLLMAGFTKKAIETLRRGLAFDSSNTEGRGLLMQAENRLVRDVTRKEVPFEAIPEPAVTLEEVVDRHLTPAEAFVLSRANGDMDVAGLIDAIPLPMAEALLILQKLLQAGYLTLRRE